MKALILAGGKGTRLRPLTYAMAKQLVPVANKPILHYPMDSLYAAGIRDFGIIISPETGDSVQESMARWQPEDALLYYIVQAEPAGLAHAVKIAEDYLGNDDFVMYLGDNLINADLSAHLERFQHPNAKGKRADASILLARVSNPSSFGVAELDEDGNVARLVEKPAEPKSDLALVGVYVFTQRIFEAVNAIEPSRRGELEITDAIQWLVDAKATVSTHIHTGWWLDTGKKDDLLSANRIVLDDTASEDRAVVDPEAEIDASSELIGSVTVGRGTILRKVRIQGPAIIGANCLLEDAFIGPYVSIADDCRLRDCQISNSVLLQNCVIDGVRGQIEGSLLGKGCRVEKAPRHPQLGQESHQFVLADHSDVRIP
jgi:glucose-1-phosphate thymidylyltransferase